MQSFIASCSSAALTDLEKNLFRACDPLGFILFKRNIENPDQLRRLTHALRDSVGRDAPILIDQEGGRVQRMGPPHWPAYPAAGALPGMAEVDQTARAIARDLIACGIDVNCAPVMDVLFPQTHDVIGNRAYADNPDTVFACAWAACRAFIEAGITPVMKHIPGHGRAESDSHHDLPVVAAPVGELRDCDFVPFRRMAAEPFAAQLWGMTAHVVYTGVDPVHPASASPDVIGLIRTDIGFEGLLVSDDISMNALARYGAVEGRALQVLEAGCDIALYCAGIGGEMERLAETIPSLSDTSRERYERSRLRGRHAA